MGQPTRWRDILPMPGGFSFNLWSSPGPCSLWFLGGSCLRSTHRLFAGASRSLGYLAGFWRARPCGSFPRRAVRCTSSCALRGNRFVHPKVELLGARTAGLPAIERFVDLSGITPAGEVGSPRIMIVDPVDDCCPLAMRGSNDRTTPRSSAIPTSWPDAKFVHVNGRIDWGGVAGR
jgi:hypothetical protein